MKIKKKEKTSENTTDNSKKEKLFAVSNVKDAAKTVLVSKGLKATTCGLVLVMGIAYLVSLLMGGSTGFTIKTINNEAVKDGHGIAISETRGFSNGTVKLSAQAIEDMDNITYDWLPFDELDTQDGSHNGENYLAYTFYLKSTGKETEDIEAELKINQVSLNVDAAIRVLVYRDGKPTIYARSKEGGGSESYPEGIVNFEAPRSVFKETIQGLNPDEIKKYTVVIWLEGEDPECIDNIRSGMMNLEMDFQVIE